MQPQYKKTASIPLISSLPIYAVWLKNGEAKDSAVSDDAGKR